MIKHKVSGTEGLVISLISAAIMGLLGYYLSGNSVIYKDLGICLPSPNLWDINALAGAVLNVVMILGIGLSLQFFNKRYSVIQSTDTVLPCIFLIMAVSNPWNSGGINPSTLMVMMNLISLAILFGCYRQRNATQELFVVATILSLGSMFQYSYLIFIPVYIIIALMMKCFGIKEFLAMGLGLIAPYWVGIGLGLVPLERFSTPTLSNMFNGVISGRDLFLGLLNVGITGAIAFILSLNNAVKLYAGNTQRRLYNNSIVLLGLICVVAIAIDFKNFETYIGTIYFVASVAIANMFALWNIRKGYLWMLFIALIYVVFYILEISQ